MNQGIQTVNLVFDDGSNLLIENNLFSHLYIANVDHNANEIPYEKLLNTKSSI